MISQKREQREMEEKFSQMYEALREWRAAHPGASFDEIAAQVTPQRRGLMGELLGELARQGGSGVELAGLKCGDCGQEMAYKGELKRGVTHLEGETELHRAYDHCAHCESGLFPLDQDLKLVKHHWTPETIKQAVRAGTEIASHRRAAQSFAEATKIPMSKSSLGRLVNE